MASVLPDAPRIVTDFDPFAEYTLTGSTYSIASGASIATGIAAAIAQGKQIVELAANGVYTEAVTLPVHPFDWMILRTAGAAVARDTRVTPALATSNHFAVLQVPDNAYGLIPAVGGGRWIVESIEVRSATTNQDTHALVMLTNDVDAMDDSLRDIPYKMAARHLYVHGTGTDGYGTLNRRAGIVAGANECEIVDCWISQINYNALLYGGQAQGIGVIAGIGKLRIENNFIWGASEPIAFGGAAQPIPCKGDQVTYSDVIIRRNHIYRTPAVIGVQASENGIEFKIGRRVTIERNIFENTWPTTQTGRALVLWSAECEEKATNWAQTCDILVQNNWFKNQAMAAQLSSQYHGYWDPPYYTDVIVMPWTRRLRLYNNLWTGMGSAIARAVGDPIGNPAGNYSSRIFDLDNDLADCSIENNTFINDGGTLIMTTGTNAVDPSHSFTRLDFRYNVIGQTANYGNLFFNPGSTAGSDWTDANANGTNRWASNLLLVPGGAGADPRLPYGGAQDTVVQTLAALQLVDSTYLMSDDTKYADLANCAFAPASPYYGQGKGCDVASLITALVGVEAPSDQLALYD